MGAEWNSIIHASFRLGGGFSGKTLTAKSVEAVDANPIPVLHVSVGGTQPDALVCATVDRSLRSFYRERIDVLRSPNKRPLNQNIAPNRKRFRKKLTLRPSRQQQMEDLLAGLEG